MLRRAAVSPWFQRALLVAAWLTGLAATAALLHAFWSVHYLALQDHPSHLFREKVLVDYWNPRFDFHRNFRRNWGLTPNQLTDAVVWLLAQTGCSVEGAARGMIGIYLVLLP